MRHPGHRIGTGVCPNWVIPLFGMAILAIAGCGDTGKQGPPAGKLQADPHYLTRSVSEASKQKIEKFCADCHDLPRSSSFPVDAWKHEVERGFEFYDRSGRTDLELPNLYDTIAYFTQQAPSSEEFTAGVRKIPAKRQLPSAFQRLEFDDDGQTRWIANVEFYPLAQNQSGQAGWVACDMKNGSVSLYPLENPSQVRLLAKAQAPVNSTISDLDQDGHVDILVSDIGDYRASDSQKGKIIWLRSSGTGFEVSELAAGLGRVCQTSVQDFDQDGDNDILVAEFGYFTSGSIYLLLNDGKGFSPGNFIRREIDPRHGTVRVQPFDFDGDGDLDFAAAIAQEYETVEIFVNDGKANFQSREVFSAGFPSYGSSGIELVDLDQDGDGDILYSNGDTFDSLVPKDYHSIQWLENLGNLQFRHHHIASMPGVHCSRAADFDGDGDLDIVSVAFMTEKMEGIEFDSMVYLQNNGNQQFEKLWLEKDTLFYPNVLVGDFNADGQADFATGTVAIADEKNDGPPLKVYLNTRDP
ncbi:MAG: VCBS repeat-containing protein [Planctomycetota bacterium]|nr:VCBS repeat-containing protein [Planctomycetota bacterium]